MRKVRYSVASSLDGFIAGPNEEIDWIVMDPDIDFAEIYRRYSTAVMGRLTYEMVLAQGKQWLPPMETVVISRTLRQEDHPEVTIAKDAIGIVRELRERDGKDIWLYGGGALFRTLLGANLVDVIEVAVMPAVLGEGIPLLPPPYRNTKLKLTSHRIYGSGIAWLDYEVA